MKTVIRIVLLGLALCGLCTTAFAAQKQKVTLVYVEWPCAVVTTNIAKIIIEDKLGRSCEILPVSVAVKFQALAQGEADAAVCAWLPNTQKAYWNKVKNRVDDLGVIVGGARLGWVVPDYVPYKSIPDLKGKAGEFEGKIYGIDPGAEYMNTSEKAIKGYELDGFSLIEGTDATMVASLADAIRRKQPIVVTGWAPHWKFGRWDLHFLDDPKGYFGEEEEIHAVGRKGLKEDMPDVHAFLSKFHYVDTKQLQKLMAEVRDTKGDPYAVAKKFVSEHKELVESWQ